MKKTVNVGTLGHIDFGKVLGIRAPTQCEKIAKRKKRNLLRELSRRQKRLDKLKDT